MRKVWLITGGAKGMGYAVAMEALKNGDSVIATTRKENDFVAPTEYKDQILNLKLDVTDKDEKAFADVAEAGVKKFGKIDILLNNAGRGRITFFEETSEENMRQLFETNLFGMMKMTKAVLPIMRKKRSGHIINVSSTASFSPGPVLYHTSKFAVTGFSTSLAFEVAPFGIKVTNAVPGMFGTNFYNKNVWGTNPDNVIEDYNESRWQDSFTENVSNMQFGDLDLLAKRIVEVVSMDNPPSMLPLGDDAPTVIEGWCESIQKDINKL